MDSVSQKALYVILQENVRRTFKGFHSLEPWWFTYLSSQKYPKYSFIEVMTCAFRYHVCIRIPYVPEIFCLDRATG